MNDGWSWWGWPAGRVGQQEAVPDHLRLPDVQGLTNLVWVWNVKDVSMGSIGEYWPGSS
ncbi:hypothetical protein [Nonomuraea rubra]|uniref:hypothetical protein n=1 Tax=Nonomuraea rubra TaxID=46180 RepID=UPI0031EC74BE